MTDKILFIWIFPPTNITGKVQTLFMLPDVIRMALSTITDLPAHSALNWNWKTSFCNRTGVYKVYIYIISEIFFLNKVGLSPM